MHGKPVMCSICKTLGHVVSACKAVRDEWRPKTKGSKNPAAEAAKTQPPRASPISEKEIPSKNTAESRPEDAPADDSAKNHVSGSAKYKSQNASRAEDPSVMEGNQSMEGSAN